MARRSENPASFLRSILAGRAGFSLLEVIIATAASSLILLMVYSAHRSVMSSIYELTGVADFYEGVNLALHRLDRDISYAYFNRNNSKICFIGDNEQGDASRGRLNFVSACYTELSIAGNPKLPSAQSDIREVGYFLRPHREKSGLFYLIRREDVHFDDEPESGGPESVVLDNVTDIKFEFRQKSDWTSKWDSREDRQMPLAVRTTVRVMNYRGNVEEFVILSFINKVQ